MQIGKTHWRWRSWDSSGVPRGGRFGNVDWFVKEAAPHGFDVAWSDVQGCFFIYTVAGNGKVIPQFTCQRADGKGPVPLNDQLLSILVFAKESYAGSDTLARKLERMHADEEYKDEFERRQLEEDMEKDVMAETYKSAGLVSRGVSIIVPARA